MLERPPHWQSACPARLETDLTCLVRSLASMRHTGKQNKTKTRIKKRKDIRLGIVDHTYNLLRQEDGCKFTDSLGYIASCRLTWLTG